LITVIPESGVSVFVPTELIVPINENTTPALEVVVDPEGVDELL